jgi:hypothetical protein
LAPVESGRAVPCDIRERDAPRNQTAWRQFVPSIETILAIGTILDRPTLAGCALPTCHRHGRRRWNFETALFGKAMLSDLKVGGRYAGPLGVVVPPDADPRHLSTTRYPNCKSHPALVFEALLHELDILGDRLVEFVDLLAAEDAALLIVRGNAKR